MTVQGTITISAALLAVLVAAAVIGWNTVEAVQGEVQFPSWTLIGILIGFAAVIGCSFRPHLAKFLAPVYAVAQGVVVGAISHAFDIAYNGIVLQAVGATMGVFAVTLVMYRTRIVRVTDRFRRTVIAA